MNGRVITIIAGIGLTVLVHAGLATGYVVYRGTADLESRAKLGSAGKVERHSPPLLCGKLRCRQLEVKRKRRDPEPVPVKDLEVLEATMIPALGGVEPDAKKLPEIETFERPQIFEDAVNLSGEPSKLDKLIKDVEAKEEKKDPKNKDALKELLSDEPLDPRARAKDLSRLTGFKEGEIGGQGMELKLGSAYSNKVAKEISKVFRTPPFLDEVLLKKLQTKVQVTRMTFDGAIEEFRIVTKSIDKSFDDAAIAAIKQFVAKEGGQKRLPVPEPEVLRFINAKGLAITLDGRLMRR